MALWPQSQQTHNPNSPPLGLAMAKKRRAARKTPLDVGIDVLALLPWWVCLLLAIGSFWYLRMAAAAPVPADAGGDLATQVQRSLIGGVVAAAQYIVPVVCLAAAGLSFFARAHRTSLLRDVEQAHSAAALADMSWREFEMLVGEAFRRRGYAIKETGGNGPDGGIDLVLTKAGEKFVVQCKQWKAQKVGVEIVREHFGVMVAAGATGGFVVTSGRFTQAGMDFAKGRNITLIDGPALFAMIQDARNTSPQTAQSAPVTLPPSPVANVPRAARSQAAPSCPQCSAAMAQRTARSGSNAGNTFWGCTQFPRCRGVRPL